MPQADGLMSEITADAAVQTSNYYTQETRETQTNSPFECSKYCGEIFPDKAAWKIHMMKDHKEDLKIMSRRHSGFLYQALEQKSITKLSRDPDVLRFLETYQEL